MSTIERTPGNDWVWVTGASSGIGAALARRLLEQGRRVLVSARGTQGLRALVDDFPQTCVSLPVDLTDRDSLAQAGQQLRELTSSLQAVVINAGNCEYIDVKRFSAEPFQRVMDINLQGAANTLELALPLLRECRNRPQVVAVGSMVTLLPLTRSQAYGASKAALEYFMNSLRVDLLREGIDVTLVRPGFVKTPLTDRNDFEMPFLVSPEVAAEHIVRAMSRRTRLAQFPWQLVSVMKLISWLPLGFQTRLLAKMVKD